MYYPAALHWHCKVTYHLLRPAPTEAASRVATSEATASLVLQRDCLKKSQSVQVSKTSVSHKTSSKTHTKSAKRALRTKLPPNCMRQVSNGAFRTRVSYESSSESEAGRPIGAKASISSFAIPTLQATPADTPRQSQGHSDVHLQQTSQPHDSLRLPQKLYFHTCNTHKVLRLPRKVRISHLHNFSKFCTTPHTWNDFDTFSAQSPHTPIHQNHHLS